MENVSLELAKNLSCTEDKNPNSILSCLKRKPAPEIQLASYNMFLLELPMSIPFVPMNDDKAFFKGNIAELLSKGHFKRDVSAIIGTVNDEGTLWLPYFLNYFGFVFDSELPVEAKENQALISEGQYGQSMGLFMTYFNGSKESKDMIISDYKELFSARKTVG
ncbi:hypothetical protein KIN20_034689, partial [Parelaphostrongylus tenuis]